MNKTLSFALVIGLTLLSACGKKGYDGLSGRCSSEYVSDYNDVARKSRYARTVGDAQEVISLAKAFKQKYPGVSCDAAVEGRFTSERIPTTINESHMDALIQSAENAIRNAR